MKERARRRPSSITTSPSPSPRPRRRWMLVVTSMLVLLTSMAAPSVGASAGPKAPAQPLALELISRSLVVPPNGTFTAEVSVAGFGPELEVSVVVFGRMSSAEELTTEPTEPINRLEPGSLADAPVSSDGILTVRMPIRDGEPFDDIDRVRVTEPGVYPVVIELRDTEGQVASIRTDLIRLPTVEDGPANLPVVFILGVRRSTGDEQISGGMTITEVTELLERFPTVVATVVLGDGVLAELEAEPDMARGFSQALGTRPAVSVLEPSVDVSGLVAIGEQDRHRKVVADNQLTFEQLALTRAGRTVVVEHEPTRAGASYLLDTGVSTVIRVGSSASRTGQLEAGNGDLALVTLGTNAELLDDGPVLQRSHHILARGVLEQPPDGDPKPIVIAVDQQVDDPVDVLGPLMEMAETEAGLEAFGLSAVVDPSEQGLALGTRPSEDLSPLVEPLGVVDDLLSTYQGFYLNGPNTPADYDQRITRLLATGTEPRARDEAIAAMTSQLEIELQSIGLPENQSVTLAAQSAPIPLTVENGTSGARQVVLRFESDKIEVAENGKLIIVEPGTRSIDVQIEARSLGVSPLEVSVETPDGRHVLATTRFQVRSTAVPGVGLAISAVGLVLLAVWWYLSIRRRRCQHPSRSGKKPTAPTPSTDLDQGPPAIPDNVSA